MVLAEEGSSGGVIHGTLANTSTIRNWILRYYRFISGKHMDNWNSPVAVGERRRRRTGGSEAAVDVRASRNVDVCRPSVIQEVAMSADSCSDLGKKREQRQESCSASGNAHSPKITSVLTPNTSRVYGHESCLNLHMGRVSEHESCPQASYFAQLGWLVVSPEKEGGGVAPASKEKEWRRTATVKRKNGVVSTRRREAKPTNSDVGREKGGQRSSCGRTVSYCRRYTNINIRPLSCVTNGWHIMAVVEMTRRLKSISIWISYPIVMMYLDHLSMNVLEKIVPEMMTKRKFIQLPITAFGSWQLV
ncbi:hypothetical protein LXL04_002437 [Taraxacum kok-saghyz]